MLICLYAKREEFSVEQERKKSEGCEGRSFAFKWIILVNGFRFLLLIDVSRMYSRLWSLWLIAVILWGSMSQFLFANLFMFALSASMHVML